MTTVKRPNLHEVMKCDDLPEGSIDGLVVERFVVEPNNIESMRLSFTGRGCPAGTYTRILADNRLWMSDTPAEMHDHIMAAIEMTRPGVRRVLINGLGLGMVLRAALSNPDVEHIDVVEIDPRCVALVGAHYATDPRVHLHTADAYEQCKAWPAGSAWDVAWHDIWPDLCEDNLPLMARLNRSYARRTTWQGCWGKELLLRHRRQNANELWF